MTPPVQRERAVQTAISELQAAIAFLEAPPKEAFTDFTGAPQQPDDAPGAAAKHWQHAALDRLKRMQQLISTLAAHDGLPDVSAEAAEQQHAAAATGGPSLATSSFWSDIRIAPGSRAGEASTATNKADHAVSKGGDPRPQNGHAGTGKSMLIEELNGGKGSQGAETEKLRRGGVIIEELTNEETLDVSESEQHLLILPWGSLPFSTSIP